MTHKLADLGPNAALIGIAGSRAQLATPCLVLDQQALARNIKTAADFCRDHRIALRPHGKSHKCGTIAALQIEAGAAGLCVATVGEAEAMARAGIRDLLITSTFTQPNKFLRAASLAAQGCRLFVVADDPDMVDQLDKAAAQAGVVIEVLVDVDLGRRRNGVVSAAQAVAVADRIAASGNLRFGGMQAYASHISHVPSYAERLRASRACADVIMDVRSALIAAGHNVQRVSGGSTGTLFMDPGLGCYTELQCGSYVFSDVEYGSLDLDEMNSSPFAAALFVKVSVIGRNVEGRVTCDGGNKHFSAKETLPAFRILPAEGAIYRPDSDEHGIIELPNGAPQPALGASFEMIVPHCDPTVNLYDHFHVVDGDKLIDIWPIEARGAF
ncbi:MAG: DSD1 family PLP-dependent enzyme [Beijerinckiaceae bacterium]|nr:MAG: DSD1 family PLP-dependent enzyme [Beijerinckiaceae bacterium]